MNKIEYASLGETLFDETLPNGLRLLVAKKPGFRQCHAMFAAHYGGADRRFRVGEEWTDTPAGVAHYLEHKMFDMPDGANILAEFSARGADPNAFTSEGMTAYHFTCTEGFEDNLRLLLHYVTTPYYTPESVEKERGIISQEILAGENDPEDRNYHQMMGCLYERHPIRDAVVGTAESIAAITPEILYRCHGAFYRPSNMTLCCVGDVDPDAVADTAMELLGSERDPAPVRDYGEPEAEYPERNFAEGTMAVSKPIFWLGTRLEVPAEGPERLRQRLTAELAMDWLLGESSALYARLYSQGLLSRNFGSMTDAAAGTAQALFYGESRDPRAVRDALLERLDRVAREGLDKNAFERCRRARWGRELSGLDRFRTYAYALTEGSFDGWNPLDVFPMLNALDPEDAAAFLCENLTDRRLVLSVIRPEE